MGPDSRSVVQIDRSDLSARLSQEERRSFTAGEEHVAATQSIADLQGAVAQLLEAVGSSQGHLQQELLKSKVRLQLTIISAAQACNAKPYDA